MPARRHLVLIGVAALALATLSLLLGDDAAAFDADAWVVWAREVVTLSVDTSAGPSWKPLPVLLLTPVAALPGDAADAAVWLVLARAGALLAVAGIAVLAHRALAGGADAGPRVVAAVLAAALIVVSPWWFFNGALGNSEPLLVACIAWAAVAHREHPRAAFALGVAAALLRPEVWPFIGAYGLWLARSRRGQWPLVVAGGALTVVLWGVPELFGTGTGSLSAATGTASEQSAVNADFPFGAVLQDLAEELTPLPLAFAVIALLGAAPALGRDGERVRHTTPLTGLRTTPGAWAWAAVGWTLLVAVMAQAGFAGNPRYLIPALAGLALAAAVAAVRLAGRKRAFQIQVALLVAGATLALTAGDLDAQLSDLRERERLTEEIASRPPPCDTEHRTLLARVTGRSIPDAECG